MSPTFENSKSTIEASSRPEERKAAMERVRAYPYRFPRSQSVLGGNLRVADNQARLLRYFYLERRLAQALGAWTLSIPDFEVKIETGRHIFYHADAAKSLRERLTEQEITEKKVDIHRDADLDLLIEETLSAEDAPELLVGIHQVLGRALQQAYRHHMDLCDPVADAPTRRVFQRILLDTTPMLEWAEGAIDAYIAGGVEEDRLTRWRWHLERVLAAVGGVDGRGEKAKMPNPLRSKQKPFQRGTVPRRDSRFATFIHTGDYHVADGAPRFTPGSYEAERLGFFRTQRDEVDAIEAFGTFVWDIRFRDFMAEYMLARITWDECRHTEIGHHALQDAGYQPFELPNRLTSSTCRGPMEMEFAMAEINLFGEVSVLRTIDKLVGEAQARGDTLLAHASDYVRADERTHVRKGEYIRKHMSDLSLKDLEYQTRVKFTAALRELDALPEGGEFDGILSREEIEHYVGE